MSLLAPNKKSGCKVVTWLVREGDELHEDQSVLRYEYKKEWKGQMTVAREELKAEKGHMKVEKLMVKEGEHCQAGQVLAILGALCAHEVVVAGCCATCGADVTLHHYSEVDIDQGVAMVHGVPDLKVSTKEAQRLGKQDEQRLTASQKLVLIVDLDQTLIHATTAHFVEEWMADKKNPYHDIFPFFIPGSPIKYYVKIRPHTFELLQALKPYYEMHIYTMGTRAYAQLIASIIDPNKELFGDRILSRDDGFDPNFKAPALKSIFPQGDRTIVILDDREDVWMGVGNLVRVRPYTFFPGVTDINQTPLDMKRTIDSNPPSASAIDPPTLIPATTLDINALPDGMVDKADIGSPFENLENSEGSLPAIPARRISVELLKDPHPISGTIKEGVSLDENNDNEVEMTHKRRRSSWDSDDMKGPTRLLTPEELLLASAMVEEAVRHTTLQGHDVSAKDVIRWREVGRERAIGKIVRCLALKEYISAVIQLRACRQAFVRKEATHEKGTDDTSNDGAPGTNVKRQKMNDEGKRLRENDEDIQMFGRGNSDDVDILLKFLHRPMTGLLSPIPPIPVDKDDILKHLKPALMKIHSVFYSNLTTNQETTQCLRTVQGEVLLGCHIVFSGTVPTGTPPHTSALWAKAEQFGAVCGDVVEGGVTHVVSARKGTVKVSLAGTIPGVMVVHVDWLKDCIAKWCRMDEEDYPLEDVPVHNGLANDNATVTIPHPLSLADIDFDAMDREVGLEDSSEASANEDEGESQQTNEKKDNNHSSTGTSSSDSDSYSDSDSNGDSNSNSDNDSNNDRDGDGDRVKSKEIDGEGVGGKSDMDDEGEGEGDDSDDLQDFLEKELGASSSEGEDS